MTQKKLNELQGVGKTIVTWVGILSLVATVVLGWDQIGRNKDADIAQNTKIEHIEESSHTYDKIQGQIIVRQEGMAEDIKAIREAITVIAKKEFGANP